MEKGQKASLLSQFGRKIYGTFMTLTMSHAAWAVLLRSLLRKSRRYGCTEQRGRRCNMYAAAWTMASGMNSSAVTSSMTSSLLSCYPSFFRRSACASVLSIGSTAMMSRYSTSRGAPFLLSVVTRTDPFLRCGTQLTSGCELLPSKPFVGPSRQALRASSRNPASSLLSRTRTHFPFLSSRNQSYTSWNISAFGFCRPGTLTELAISR